MAVQIFNLLKKQTRQEKFDLKVSETFFFIFCWIRFESKCGTPLLFRTERDPFQAWARWAFRYGWYEPGTANKGMLRKLILIWNGEWNEAFREPILRRRPKQVCKRCRQSGDRFAIRKVKRASSPSGLLSETENFLDTLRSWKGPQQR